MNYPAAELRGIKMNFYLINPDAEHRGILLIKLKSIANLSKSLAPSSCFGRGFFAFALKAWIINWYPAIRTNGSDYRLEPQSYRNPFLQQTKKRSKIGTIDVKHCHNPFSNNPRNSLIA